MNRGCQVIAEDLYVEFPGGPTALSGIYLSVKSGEFVSLVGPSGCGKSTLLRAMAGLQPLTSGTLTRTTSEGLTSSLAYVFQEATLLPWRNVVDNIALPLELAGVAAQDRHDRATRTMLRTGLHNADAGKRPYMLSGGMQMRVSLARALVTQPKLLLLDEPFAALDEILRQQLNEELLRIWLDQGWTAAFVTHNVAEAVFLSQRVLVMSSFPGRIIAEIAVDLDYPRLPSVRETPEFTAIAARIASHLRHAAGAPT